MILQKLRSANVIHPPRWLVDNVCYMTQTGSVAYGVSAETSDIDVYGFCMPPKDMIFPHLAGEILGFGTQIKRFEQWSEHHVDPKFGNEHTYDFTIYGIVRYFQLCMECNPNMIDSLFTPLRCVLYSTAVGEHVRENRKLFLHKGAWHKFKGYSYSQMHKIEAHVNASNPSRAESIQKHGYDVKFAYHVVRLLNEVEQIMVEHDLDLERNREQLKAIRRGEWTLDQIKAYFAEKEKTLENTYAVSTLRHKPDEAAIKTVLLQSLEMHFGSLDTAIKRDPSADRLIRDIEEVLARHR